METCQTCRGTGEIVTCIDDLCANSDFCIHGDGYDICPDCGGTGELVRGDEDEEYDEAMA